MNHVHSTRMVSTRVYESHKWVCEAIQSSYMIHVYTYTNEVSYYFGDIFLLNHSLKALIKSSPFVACSIT